MKVCSKCKTEQSLESFNKEQSRKDGLYPWCKGCLRKHRQDQYEKRLRKFKLTHKVCSLCKENKPRDQFNLYEGRNLKYRCLVCEEDLAKTKEQNLRKCSCCKHKLPLNAFYSSRRDGRRSTCIECLKKQLAQPSVKEYRRDKALKKYFGISLQQYRQLLDKQKYTCPICLKPLEGISNPVDHAHRGLHEGKVRAILHDRCNRFVMHNHHNSGELFRAADLIDNPLTDWIVPVEYLKSRKKKKRSKRKTK